MSHLYKYKIHSINQGFCRINYTSRIKEHEFYHCLQDDGIKITFYLCSKDFEPMWESGSFPNDRVYLYEKPDGNSELERKVRAWIDNE